MGKQPVICMFVDDLFFIEIGFRSGGMFWVDLLRGERSEGRGNSDEEFRSMLFAELFSS